MLSCSVPAALLSRPDEDTDMPWSWRPRLLLLHTLEQQPAAAPAAAKTYRNPLLPDREMADPFVLRVDSKYYLYATTDARGYEAFVSDDLVHWERKGRVFHDPRGGDWAPEVFHHRRGDGKFYLYYTDNMPGPERGPLEKQIGVAVADSPLGPFVDKGVLATHSIDAHLFQDDDGSLYLYYVDLTGGFKIIAQPMADPLTKKGEPKVVIRPTEDWEKRSGEVTEGPVHVEAQGHLLPDVFRHGRGLAQLRHRLRHVEIAHRAVREIRRQPHRPARRQGAGPGPSLRGGRPGRQALAGLSPEVGRRPELAPFPGD